MLGSLVSSHSRQIQSSPASSRALREAGTIVTPQVGQIGGRSSSTSEVCVPARRKAAGDLPTALAGGTAAWLASRVFLSRMRLELEPHEALVADHPCIVTGFDHIRI